MAKPAFVKLSPDRTHFMLNEQPFFFAGVNCYYLMTRAADPKLVGEVTSVLDTAAAAGLTVVRTWAFNEGGAQWNALQEEPGVFCERVFRALDFVVAEAGRRGLKLLLDLTNYWADYGGMTQYVRWSWQQRGACQEECRAEDFYDDSACQAMFRNFVSTLLLRVNTLTGVEFRHDPTILALGLANEPQCHGDRGRQSIARWAARTAEFVKSLDPNHLVTLDCEGFLGPSSTAVDRGCNPYCCDFNGCDFLADCGSPHIDFACCHLYPDLWLPQASEQAKLDFGVVWLEVHAKLAKQMGKPLVLSEFGKKEGSPGGRSHYFHRVLGKVLQLMQPSSHRVAGSIFWMTAAPSYPHNDGFTIYLPPAPSARPTPTRGAQKRGNSTQGLVARARLGLARMLGQAGPGVLDDVPAGERAGQGGANGTTPAAEGDTVVVILEHAAAVAQLNGRPRSS